MALGFPCSAGARACVPLSIHAVGRPRLNIHAALAERVSCVQLRVAQAWGVVLDEFLLALTGVLLDPSAPLVHYLNRGGYLGGRCPWTTVRQKTEVSLWTPAALG